MKPGSSALFVCVGNTCRSPMAEALAKRRWPHCIVRSAGISVHSKGQPAAWEAASAMTAFGLSLDGHRATRIGEVNLDSFDYIIALDSSVNRFLRKINVPRSKVRELYVCDPFQSDPHQYEEFADSIGKKLEKLKF